jgi:hypothetical protein
VCSYGSFETPGRCEHYRGINAFQNWSTEPQARAKAPEKDWWIGAVPKVKKGPRGLPTFVSSLENIFQVVSLIIRRYSWFTLATVRRMVDSFATSMSAYSNDSLFARSFVLQADDAVKLFKNHLCTRARARTCKYCARVSVVYGIPKRLVRRRSQVDCSILLSGRGLLILSR